MFVVFLCLAHCSDFLLEGASPVSRSSISGYENVHVSYCLFQNLNDVNNGGALMISGITYTCLVENCRFLRCFSSASNTAYQNNGGGGIYSSVSKCILENLCFFECTTLSHGQGIHSGASSVFNTYQVSIVGSDSRAYNSYCPFWFYYSNVSSIYSNCSSNIVSLYSSGIHAYASTTSVEVYFSNIANCSSGGGIILEAVMGGKFFYHHMNIVNNKYGSHYGVLRTASCGSISLNNLLFYHNIGSTVLSSKEATTINFIQCSFDISLASIGGYDSHSLCSFNVVYSNEPLFSYQVHNCEANNKQTQGSFFIKKSMLELFSSVLLLYF